MDNRKKQEKYADYFNKGEKILELGSGRGAFLEICGERGIAATGIDKNPDCELKKKKLKVVKADFVKYLEKAEKLRFDGVYGRHVVEHLTESSLRRVFKNIRKILKKGGRLIVIFPNVKNVHVASRDFWKDDTHIKPYSVDFIRKELKAGGFKIMDCGQDDGSWDNSFFKRIYRKIAGALSGVDLSQPPDVYVVSRK